MLFATRRALRCAGPLVAILAVIAILGGTLAASAALAERFVDDGSARLVADADPADRGIVVDAPADPDARGAVDAAVRDAFRGVPVDIARAVQNTAAAGSGLGTVLLISGADLADHAELIAGRWPRGGDEVAVAASAAARSGIAPGDALTLSGRPVTITGVWQPADPTSTVWAGMPAVASGRQDDAVGPLLGDEELVSRDGGRARWTISAAGPVAADAVAGYRAGIARLQASLDDIEGLGYRVGGGWDATLDRAASAAAVARGLLSVPLALVVAIGLLTLGVLAHAAGRRRAGGILLLRARGASRTAGVVETIGVTAAVAVVAGLLATGAAFALGAGAVAAIGLPAAVVAVAVVLVAAVMSATSLASPRARGDVGRRSLAGVAGGLALTAILAGLAAAQLLSSGLLSDGRTDVAAAAAPALALLAAALVAALLAAPVASIGERLVRGIRSLPPVLAMRRIARQSAVVVAGVLSLSLASGALAFALSATTRAANVVETDVAHAVGADVRAVYDRSPIVDAAHPSMSAAAVPALDAFAAFVSPATAGQVPVALVALPAARLASAIDVPPDDLGAVQPLALDGALELTVTAAMGEGGAWPGGAVVVSAWLLDRDGAARVQRLGAVPVDGRAHTLRSAPEGGLRLAAVELTAASAPGTVSAQVAVDGTPARLSLSVDPQTGRGRGLTVTGLGEDVPVVVTRALADRLALRPGASLSLGLGTLARPLEGRVVAVREWLPGVGTGPGASVDLAALAAAALEMGGSVPAAGQLWTATTDVPAASLALRAAAEQPVRVLTAASVGTAAVIGPVLVLSVAGAGVVAVLAILAFVAVVLGVVRARRAEAVPLRAFGFSRVRMRATAALELAGAGAFAVACGAAAGLAVAAWLGPALLAAVAIGGVS